MVILGCFRCFCTVSASIGIAFLMGPQSLSLLRGACLQLCARSRPLARICHEELIRNEEKVRLPGTFALELVRLIRVDPEE